MRGVWGIAAVLVPLVSCGPAAAETLHGARVAMPFSCVVERGRVRLQPGAEQVYGIADRAESHPFAACPAGPSRQCRTFTIHRFTLACPGGRAPWVEVVAAAVAARPELQARVELEDGRLLLGRKGPGAGVVRDCYSRISGAGVRARIWDPVLQEECWSLTRRGAAPRVELPLGFAPLTLARARLLPASRPAPVPASLVTPLPASHPAPASIAAPPPAVREGVPAMEALPAASAARFAVPVSTWRTQVRAGGSPHVADAPAAATEPRDTTPESTWWVLAGAVALLGAPLLAWAMLARRRIPPGAMSPPGGSERRADTQAIDSLKASGLELLPVIRNRLDQLPAAMPLRQVLARELHTAAQRFSTISLEQPAGAAAERRHRGRLQAVVRDLSRLAEITDGAHSSLGGQALVPAEPAEPRDKTEAFALLGVNPDVDERICKKLVEALRQSWHPDLARDEADRRRREDRIKLINVAWDLIQGKRVEA